MNSSSASEALLIVNLGSPKSTRISDVRRYLQEFLMDPLVLDIPIFWRLLLVYGPISLLRARKSAEAYASIWDKNRGSPLLYHTEDFVKGLRALLGSGVRVEMGMRYASPSLESSIQKILGDEHPQKLTIALMYPQYALSSTETALQQCERILKKFAFKGELRYIRDFYSRPEFIESFAQRAREVLPSNLEEDTRVVMSFHGIPERHIHKLPSYDASVCLSQNGKCCDVLTEQNKNCYRAQCFASARLLAKNLGLATSQYRVTFQSRLGRTPWIKPYTDYVLKDLAKEGIKKVYVMCPAFVTDCLETLEEIQKREAEAFREYGGDELTLVPCLNAHPKWIENFANLYRSM